MFYVWINSVMVLNTDDLGLVLELFLSLSNKKLFLSEELIITQWEGIKHINFRSV